MSKATKKIPNSLASIAAMAKNARERATSEKVTPELIRREFVLPLAQLSTMFASEAAELQKAIDEGKLERDYLPIVIKGITDRLADIRLFAENVLPAKRRSGAAGKLRWRDEYLADKRKKYRES